MAKQTAPRQWNSTLPRREKGLQRTGARGAGGSTQNTKRPVTRSNFPAPARNGLQKKGKKTREWDKVRAKLKVAFEKAGITSCEIKCEGCWLDAGLGFAHSVKRRFITTPELMAEAALACINCHNLIEAMPHTRMADVVRTVIAHRPVPVEKIFQ